MEPKNESKNIFLEIASDKLQGGFANRDSNAKIQEQQKIIDFKIITNDRTHQSMKMLIDLKNIFSKQLPKMPKEYIVRLVFDRNHQSMVIIKQNRKVIGGICFRVFYQEMFAEIAFLAISSTQQVRGYGTRLMNKLKQQMQNRKIQFIMTYADNLALGYFRKQGFSKDYRIPVERWRGYTKNYEGGAMMQCCIHPTVDYSQISTNIKKQKEIIINKIKQLSLNQIEYDGKKLQKIAQKYKRINIDGQEEQYRIDPLKIPGVLEGGWIWNDHQELRKSKQFSFQLQCQNIIQILRKHPSVWPFREAVSKKDVPDYFKIIKKPIDLKTIQIKLINGQYSTYQAFHQDITQMFTNCRTYNQRQTIYYKCADQLQQFITPHFQVLKQNSSQFNKKNKIKSK